MRLDVDEMVLIKSIHNASNGHHSINPHLQTGQLLRDPSQDVQTPISDLGELATETLSGLPRPSSQSQYTSPSKLTTLRIRA